MKVSRVECLFKEMMDGYYINDLQKAQKELPDNELCLEILS